MCVLMMKKKNKGTKDEDGVFYYLGDVTLVVEGLSIPARLILSCMYVTIAGFEDET